MKTTTSCSLLGSSKGIRSKSTWGVLQRTSEGSFSAVPKPMFASKYLLYNLFSKSSLILFTRFCNVLNSKFRNIIDQASSKSANDLIFFYAHEPCLVHISSTFLTEFDKLTKNCTNSTDTFVKLWQFWPRCCQFLAK